MKHILLLAALLVPSAARADKSLDKSAAWDCAKDPVVQIGTGRGKYTFKGTCTTIEVDGGQNTLVIEAVDTLSVGGAQNTITVATVATIDVGGTGNTITWKKAKSGDKPKLKGQPEKNTITQAK